MDRVPLQEACRRLGISEKTLRRRIHAGRVDAELVDGHWMVRLSEQSLDNGQTRDPEYGQGDQTEFVKFLREQIREKDAQLGQAFQTIREMQQEIHRLTQLALPAPKKPSLWRRIWKRYVLTC